MKSKGTKLGEKSRYILYLILKTYLEYTEFSEPKIREQKEFYRINKILKYFTKEFI